MRRLPVGVSRRSQILRHSAERGRRPCARPFQRPRRRRRDIRHRPRRTRIRRPCWQCACLCPCAILQRKGFCGPVPVETFMDIPVARIGSATGAGEIGATGDEDAVVRQGRTGACKVLLHVAFRCRHSTALSRRGRSSRCGRHPCAGPARSLRSRSGKFPVRVRRRSIRYSEAPGPRQDRPGYSRRHHGRGRRRSGCRLRAPCP